MLDLVRLRSLPQEAQYPAYELLFPVGQRVNGSDLLPVLGVLFFL